MQHTSTPLETIYSRKRSNFLLAWQQDSNLVKTMDSLGYLCVYVCLFLANVYKNSALLIISVRKNMLPQGSLQFWWPLLLEKVLHQHTLLHASHVILEPHSSTKAHDPRVSVIWKSHRQVRLEAVGIEHFPVYPSLLKWWLLELFGMYLQSR